MGTNLQLQIDAVMAAPAIFIGLIPLVAGVAWAVLHLMYKNRLSTDEARINALKEDNERLTARLAELTALPKPPSVSPALQDQARSAQEAKNDISYSTWKVLQSARAAAADRSERASELVKPAMDALLLTLAKEKGIKRPPETGDARIDLQTASRLIEQIRPLLLAGHDEEARERSEQWFDRLEKGSG
jgi:hypothetical protein